MGHALTRPESREIRVRVVSAAILLPPVVAAVWLGDWALVLFGAALGGIMSWEWSKVSELTSRHLSVAMIATTAVAPIIAFLAGMSIAVIFVLAALLLIFLLALASDGRERLLAIVGLPYIVIGLLAALWLRIDVADGVRTLTWVIATVIATDVGAYFAGKFIGGPKLAPSVSPKKTWAGLAGACLAAFGVGAALAWHWQLPGPIFIATLGPVLALLAQLGDLAESAWKRHYRVKDSSNLIPGHGGFLDRCDGYLTVFPFVALMTLAAGRSPVTWQL